MIASNIFRILAVAGGLGLGALAAPAEAGVFRASTTGSLEGPGGSNFFFFPLPQYSGPGTIVGVNIGLSGSTSATDFWFYLTELGITVGDYSRTWQIALLGPPNPSGGSFLEVDVPAEYVGGSVPSCEPLPFCGGGDEFPAIAGPTAFSASADVSDFSDFAGSGSNAFTLAVSRGEGDSGIDLLDAQWLGDRDRNDPCGSGAINLGHDAHRVRHRRICRPQSPLGQAAAPHLRRCKRRQAISLVNWCRAERKSKGCPHQGRMS